MSYLIDLRERKPGCTGHPVVRLNLELKKAKNQKTVKIVAKKDDLPRRALELTLKRYGFKLTDVKEDEDRIEIFAEKC